MNYIKHYRINPIVLIFFVFNTLCLTGNPDSENNVKSTNSSSTVNKPSALNERLNKEKHKVIIIIDDVGTDMTHFTDLMNLPEKLTVSILPGEKYSKICAEIAHQKGFEVMLHQPMQPRNIEENHLGSGGIFVSMKPATIEKILIENISNIPHIKGVNNHMGSYATTKADLMRAVMKVLKAKKLYFVDSLTGGSSKAYATAVEAGIPTLKRDIFIDTNPGYDYAVRQLLNLKKLSNKKQVSVAIGHCREATIRALKKMLPELEKDGIEVTRASEVFVEW